MIRLLHAVLLTGALLAAGCSHLHLTQDRTKAQVRVEGEIDESVPVGPIAARLLPYAVLAEQAKLDDVYRTGLAVPQDYCKTGAAGDCRQYTRRAAAILDHWRLIYASDTWSTTEETAKLVACPPHDCPPELDGLGVQVWVRRGNPCREAVIAFRGTKADMWENWASNFHWLTGHLPVQDQYEQVSAITGPFVAGIKQQRCYDGKLTHITTVGHSLGGGLAQQATYVSGDIDRVYAFNPSFVTGSLDHPAKQRWENAEGLVIERIYEHGEILAFPRLAMRTLFPPTACQPRVASIRVDLVIWTTGGQHAITKLVSGLMRVSEGERPEPHPVAERTCVFRARE